MIGMLVRTTIVWVIWFSIAYLISVVLLGAFTDHHTWEYTKEAASPIGKLVGSAFAIIHFLEEEI